MPATPALPERVAVELRTPLRLRRAGDLVTPETLRPADILASLVRRVSMLSYFHTAAPLEADFAGLRDRAAQLDWDSISLRWLDLARWSTRQEALLGIGGIVGRATLDLRPAEDLWPYLWIGQWIGTGKGTTMGLGQIEVAGA